MKIVFKEWLRDKKACGMMGIYLVLTMIYITLNARVVVYIANAFEDPQNINAHLIFIGSVCVFQTIISMIRQYLITLVDKHLYTVLNNHYVDKILDSDYEMFTKYSVAYINTAQEFMQKITRIGINTIQMVSNLITIVVVIYSMYLIESTIVIPVFVIYAIGMLVFKYIYKLYIDIDKKFSESKRKRNQEIEDIINGFAEVRSFNTINTHRTSIHKRNSYNYKLLTKKAKYNMYLDCAIETVDTGGLIAVLIFAMKQLASGVLQQAQAMSLVMYVFRLVGPLLSILDYVDVLSENLALKDDYNNIVSYINKHDNSGSIKLSGFNNKIELNDVNFAYDESSNAVNNVSIKINKGEHIGICGESGGGKSTLFKLINKFYHPSSGSITIDGIDIWDIDNDSYRNYIGCVHQENTIFPGTIKYNIMYGNQYATESEFIEACKKAKIYDFIISLPKKFETEVGPRGLKLSGGQKQRIALARLFLKNPEIILLDEATSALDNESETFIQEAIDALEGKTIITIAHRLSTIKDSDQIYVLNSDGVVEHGTHEELVQSNGVYAKMLK